MIGYILNNEQANSVEGVFFREDTFFSISLDIDGNNFLILSDQDKESIYESEWEWILDLPTGNYVPPPSPF
jgi:hypothetical protein